MDRSGKGPGRKRGKRSGSSQLRADKIKCWLDTVDNIDLNDVAKKMGYSVGYVKDLIRGKRDVLDKHIKMISDISGIDPRLFDDEVTLDLFKIKILPEKMKLSFVVPHNLPREDRLFIGRKTELAQLFEYLSPENEEFRCAITGMGGVGKSALALKCAWQCVKEKSFEAVVWSLAQMEFLITNKVNRRRLSKLNLEDLLALILSIVDEETSKNLPSVKEQRKIALNILACKRTLLIIDNYEDVEDDEVEIFLNQIPYPSKVLVTDRRSVSAGMMIPLSGLSLDESREVLLAQCNKRKIALNENHITKILSHVGGTPLAIEWIVGLISTQHWNIEKLTSHLEKNEDSHLLEFLFSRAWDSILEISKKILLYFAVFPDGTSGEFVAKILKISERETNDFLIELLGLSLIIKVNCTREKESEFGDLVSIKNCFKMLPLTKYFARKKMEETENEIANTANKCLHDLLYEKQISPHPLSGNAVEIIKNNIDRLLFIIEASFVTGNYKLVIDLAGMVDPVLSLMGKHGKRLSITKMALDSVELLSDVRGKSRYPAIVYEKTLNMLDYRWSSRILLDAVFEPGPLLKVNINWPIRDRPELENLVKAWKRKIIEEG